MYTNEPEKPDHRLTRSQGILLLLAIATTAWTIWYATTHFKYVTHCEIEKKRLISDNTLLAADIIDELISQVQKQTEEVAASITQMSIKNIDAESQKIFKKDARSLAQFGAVISESSAIFSKDLYGDCANDSQITQNKSKIIAKKNKSVQFNINVYGAAIAFDHQVPDEVNDTFWSHYAYENGNRSKSLSDLDYTDKSDENFEWFHLAMMYKKNMWVSPYLDEAGDTHMITYSSLIYSRSSCLNNNTGCEPLGVVTADISINQLENIINRLNSEFDGFGALTTANGSYLYHPKKDYVKKGFSLADVAKRKNDADRFKVAELARNRQRGLISHVSTTTGSDSWLVVEPLEQIGWSLQNTFFKDGLYSKSEINSIRRGAIIFYSLVLVSTLMWLICFLAVFQWKAVIVWTGVSILSLLLLIGIGRTWQFSLELTKPKNSSDIAVTNHQLINSRLESYREKLNESRRNIASTTIPTGIYIHD